MERFDEESRFLATNAAEFIPSALDQELLRELERTYLESSPVVTPERVEAAVEHLETRVYLAEKDASEVEPDAQRVLLTASETLAFRSILPVIEAMRHDRRVRSIGLTTDNLAANLFEGKLDGFKRLRDPQAPVLYDALTMVKKDPFDVALVPVDPKNSPNSTALFGAKSVFGAKKMYFLSTGWVGVGSTDLFEAERAQEMETIDGIFVSDHLAADVVAHQLPDYPAEKILETGTPILDALDLAHAPEYTKAGREKLHLDDDTLAVLLMGFVSPRPGEQSDQAPRISEDTFAQTFEQMVKLAEAHPEKKLAVLIRPHPTDPNGGELLAFADRSVPPNLVVRRATNDVVTMQEATYGADVTASIVGTDNFLAPRRGRQGIFLGYDGPGMGGETLEKIYGSDIVELMNQADGLAVTRSPEDFRALIESLSLGHSAEVGKNANETSVQRMLDIMLQPEPITPAE